MTLDMEMLHSVAKKIFRLFGSNPFVARLYDFLAHGGRSSRSETLDKATKALLALEQARKYRLETLKSLIELMRSAGFSEDEIKKSLLDSGELLNVSDALESLLSYVESGSIAVRVVDNPETTGQIKKMELGITTKPKD